MSRIWAVARHMIAEAVRMKVAVVFLVFLAVFVLVLPFFIRGDGTLSGSIQNFMTYSLAFTGVLLGMLAIFLSQSISNDLTGRQIFLLATKPLSRWEYVVGKWLGITLFNAVLLIASGLAIYGMIHVLKHPRRIARLERANQKVDPKDLENLHNEILVARHPGKMTVPDFSDDAELEFQKNLEEGIYADSADRPQFDPREEKRRLAAKNEARWRVVGPDNYRTFNFENVLVERSPDKQIQLRYKTEVSQYPPDEIFRAVWQFGDPHKGTPVYTTPVRHVVGRYHTVRAPADAVAEDHTLKVRFFNQNPYAGEPPWPNVIEFRRSDPVEVLFTVGSFEGNLVRLLVLMSCKILFLASLAVLAATVFSFPVACLFSFTIFVLAGIRGFLVDSLDLASADQAGMLDSTKEFAVQSVLMVFKAIYWVVPDFSRYDAVEELVSGRNVSLVWVIHAVAELALLKTLIVLGLAILFFHRRELAEVSV